MLLLVCCNVTKADDVYSVFGDTFPIVQAHQVMVYRHLYVACLDIEARQPAWVAYKVKRSDWDTDNVLDRNFSTPNDMRDVCLEPSDYRKSPYQMGHLYGLQFVSARSDASEVNQMCAISAQRADLNTGPWLKIENAIKKKSETETITVIAGQLWIDDMPPLPKADEPHKIGSHFWIIISVGDDDIAYLLPQSAGKKDDPEIYRVDVACLKKKIAVEWSQK